MSPRTGRPKAEHPKSNDVKVRLDDEMALRLDEYCKDRNLTRAEAIRKGIRLLLASEA